MRPPQTPDAAGDAWRWLDSALQGQPVPPLLVLVGLRTEHLLVALERHAPATRVLALEPAPEHARRILASRQGDAWRTDGRLLLLTDPDYTGSDEAWRLFPTGGETPPVLVHPELQPGPGIARAREALKKILFGVKANSDARRRFAPRYLINSLRNLPSIAAGSDVRALTNAFAGTPAILVAAGPSLDRTIDDLRHAREHAVIIATDTALRPLLVAGVAPHLVVGLDPSTTNARHLQSLPECRDTWMVSESAMDPSAVAPFDDRTFWFRAAGHQPWPWLNELGLDIGRLDVWGSVLTGAFQVACLAGCDPLVVVGADLSYTGSRPYARGTTYEFDWTWSAAEGTSIEEAWRAQIAKAGPEPATDLHGRETSATPALLSFRDWMVAHAKRSGRRVINATGAGVFFGDGVEQIPLSKVMTRAVTIPPLKAIAHRCTTVRTSALATRLRAVRQTLASGELHEAPIAQWVEFSGGGFDPARVSAALDEAAYALDATRERPLVSSIVKWAPLVASQDSDSLFIQLPEAMARLRAGLQGAESVEGLTGSCAPTTPERAAALVQALALLGRICESLHRTDDLALRATPACDLPAYVFHEWPDTVRWAVAVFEAMLGKSMGRSLPRPDGRFFAGPMIVRVTHGAPQVAGVAGRPHATHACVLLAFEWLRGAASVQDRPHAAFTQAIDRFMGIQTAVRDAAGRDTACGHATLRIVAAAGGASTAIALPLGLGDAALARVLTGMRPAPRDATIELANTQAGPLSVTMSIDLAKASRRPHRAPRRDAATISITPRVLSGDVLRPSFVAYATSRGAVCVAPYTCESVLVRPDGSVEPHHTWPRPIVLELPSGEDGAVAWSNGLVNWPQADTPYVMHRRAGAETPACEDLPFRPGIGTWWRNRVFWACLPSGIGAWTGVASWAPGDDARIDLPGPALYDLQPDDESALVLHRRALGESGTYERRIVSEGWRWQPGQPVDVVDLGAHGASSCRASNGTWTARARPEADLIQFESAERRVSLVCHWPHRLAWIGRSLLVNTLEDRDVLLFEDVVSWLER